MADIEVKLREGMNRKRHHGNAQDTIVHAITAFALYGFSRVARRQLCIDAYGQRLVEMPLPGRVTTAM